MCGNGTERACFLLTRYISGEGLNFSNILTPNKLRRLAAEMEVPDSDIRDRPAICDVPISSVH